MQLKNIQIIYIINIYKNILKLILIFILKRRLKKLFIINFNVSFKISKPLILLFNFVIYKIYFKFKPSHIITSLLCCF